MGSCLVRIFCTFCMLVKFAVMSSHVLFAITSLGISILFAASFGTKDEISIDLDPSFEEHPIWCILLWNFRVNIIYILFGLFTLYFRYFSLLELDLTRNIPIATEYVPQECDEEQSISISDFHLITH